MLGDTDSEWRHQFAAIAKALRHCEGRADLSRPTEGEERVMTVVYTALWQYREATTDTHGHTHEPAAFFAARLDARRRLDAIDAETVVELTRKERNLLAEVATNRMWYWGDELMCERRPRKKRKRTASRVARVARLLDVIGWRKKIGKKKGKGRVWTVPASVLSPAIDALVDECRFEHAEVDHTADMHKKAGSAYEESANRRELARINTWLDRLLDLRTKCEEAVEGGRS